MSLTNSAYLADARRAAQDATNAADQDGLSGPRQLLLAVMFGVSWGAMVPIVWSATSPVVAVGLLAPILIAVAMWDR